MKNHEQNNPNPRCFSFFNNPINNKYPTERVDIEWVIDYITNNPNKATIEALRTMNKTDIGYKPLKKILPSISIHATWSKLQTCDIDKLSGYMYFDIDNGIPADDCDGFIKKFTEQFKDIICVAGKSVGGKGIFFYIKIKEANLLTVENFKQVQQYITENIFAGYKLDVQANKLTQPNFLSYDTNLFINRNAELSIDANIFTNKDIKSNGSKLCVIEKQPNNKRNALF